MSVLQNFYSQQMYNLDLMRSDLGRYMSLPKLIGSYIFYFRRIAFFVKECVWCEKFDSNRIEIK